MHSKTGSHRVMMYARTSPVSRSIGIRVLLVLCGSLLMALAAKVSVPMYPVPITGQTLAIPLLVALLGRNGATLAILAYLAEGAFGLPVFASGALMSATGGYLLAFPAAAFAIGLLFERGFDRSYVSRFIAIFAGTALVFAGGVAWLVAIFHLAPQNAIAVGVLPFMIGDGVKCALAAGLVPVWPKIAAKLGI
jgi:biotin transport system substrate-specific component